MPHIGLIDELSRDNHMVCRTYGSRRVADRWFRYADKHGGHGLNLSFTSQVRRCSQDKNEDIPHLTITLSEGTMAKDKGCGDQRRRRHPPRRLTCDWQLAI